MKRSALLVVDNVDKRYGAEFPPAVSHLSFSLEEGEILALLGPSGSGKTTALRLIAGFEKPDSGAIVLKGVPVAGNGSWLPPEARKVGMVFQDYALFPHLTLLDNVAFGLSGSRKDRERKALEVLAKVGMDRLASRYPHELSGGQQQRVALARALAPEPWLILLDEPFSNLDADMRADMRREVEKVLRESNMSAVLVTHDQEEAFVLADRVGVLNNGSLEQLAAPEVLYHTPATRFVADFVGEADFLPGEVQDGIVTELGVLEHRCGLPRGTRVEIMIRPDDVDFEPDDEGNGIVAGRKFRGSENRYALRLPSGARVRSSQASTRVVATGTRVKVRVKLDHIVLFPVS
ncbi:MAG TPA: ABC transporter ATP-binding protein [Candidatus Acidoferrales bacterium]|nr:ABC transporter ATP-binding protein [Candidatus Acidoferrales bacterium]